ncbi:CU044_5270 family protein [Streptomyces sp. NPDC007808]|uniref:CU044_5270 family protein n=1 Tax=Streptomyces sp. NPDC007808 TaxID=3364779 RepID=UPI0036C23C7C
MTRVRELRADTPVADRGRLAPGRARLVEAARTENRRRFARGRGRLVVAAAFAAVTATVVTATVVIGERPGRDVTPAGPPSLDLRGMSARELLERAARTVEQQASAAEPRAEQWIYTEETYEGDGEDFVSEKWLRYDGSELASYPGDGAGGKLDIMRLDLEDSRDDDRSPRQMYRFLSSLPADAEGALKALREENALDDDEGRSRAENDYTEISVLLDAYVHPPEGLAGLYRALATLPGLTLVDHLVEDEAGHRAVAVRFSGPGGAADESVDEWLLDPVTFEVVGERTISDGKVVSGNAYVAKGVVDRAGERP